MTSDERIAELEAQLQEAHEWADAIIAVEREDKAQLEARLAEANARADGNFASCERIKAKYSDCWNQLKAAEARAADADAYEYTASEAEARAEDATQWARKFAEQRDEAESVNGQLLGLIRTARAQLNDLLIDEDLDDEKLREASEGLLPNIVDGFSNALQAAAARPAESEGEK